MKDAYERAKTPLTAWLFWVFFYSLFIWMWGYSAGQTGKFIPGW